MQTNELDLSAGMIPRPIPVSAQQMPTHPLGKVTGIDHDSGLPIVKRKEPAPEPAAEAKPASTGMAAKPRPAEAKARPAAPEPARGVEGGPLHPGGPADQASSQLQKDVPVELPDGTRGRVAYVSVDSKMARVRTDAGKNVNVRQKELKVLNHVTVKAHVRMAPASKDGK